MGAPRRTTRKWQHVATLSDHLGLWEADRPAGWPAVWCVGEAPEAPRFFQVLAVWASEDLAGEHGGDYDRAISDLLRTEVAGEGFVVIPADVISTALASEQPFRPSSAKLAQSERTARLTQDLTRLFEGARLVGPGIEASLHPMAARIGPMLSTNDVVKATRTTRQNLAAQAKKRRLVRLASSQRTQWWPTFQFRRAGSKVVPHPGVQALWQALPEGTMSDWDHAAWLCTPRHDLGGDAPVDLASDARAVERSPLREVLAAYVDRLTR